MMIPYDGYNREERALCSHLFRLLHEPARGGRSPLSAVVERLRDRMLEWRGAREPLPSLGTSNAAILTEVALVRDVYQQRKGEGLGAFMDGLVRLLMERRGVVDCSLWTELPEVLRDPGRTHPRQIRQKAESERLTDLGAGFLDVYGALQAIFNAKPDFAIVMPNHLLVIEAKFTLGFDSLQLERTNELAALWASPLLRAELGYAREPSWAVLRLGARSRPHDLSWEELAAIAAETWADADDRSRIAFEAAVRTLRRGIGSGEERS